MSVATGAGLVSSIVSIVANVTANPWLTAGATLLVAIIGFIAWKFIRPWVQKLQDVVNSGKESQDSAQQDHDAQSGQSQVNQLANGKDDP